MTVFRCGNLVETTYELPRNGNYEETTDVTIPSGLQQVFIFGKPLFSPSVCDKSCDCKNDCSNYQHHVSELYRLIFLHLIHQILILYVLKISQFNNLIYVHIYIQ